MLNNVAILGMGPSVHSYVTDSLTYGKNRTVPYFDEVWTINLGAYVFKSDRLFNMHNLEDFFTRHPNMRKTLKEYQGIIYTTEAHKDFSNTVEYPLEEAKKVLPYPLFTNGLSYALTLAILLQVKTVWLYGCDFHYPDIPTREMGGQSAAYILGLYEKYGIDWVVAGSSTFMGANKAKLDEEGYLDIPLYGYDSTAWGPEKQINYVYAEKEK